MTHELPSDETEDTQKFDGGKKDGLQIIRLSEIGDSDLPVGTIIEGFNNLQGFNLIAERAGEIIMGRNPGRDNVNNQIGDPAENLKDQQTEKRFIGRATNLQAVIIPPNLDNIAEASRSFIGPGNYISFLGIRDCVPTGRTQRAPQDALVSLVTAYLLDARGIRGNSLRIVNRLVSRQRVAKYFSDNNGEWGQQQEQIARIALQLGVSM